VTRRILALFAKQPVPGQVKTRLCPPLSLDQAAACYEAMLRDILDQHLRGSLADVDRALWFTPADATLWFERETPPGYRLLAQRGRNLAERMRALFRTHADEGYGAMVLRGSDSPTLPLERITEAFRSLERADLVLCPDLDGGYSAIGLCEPQDALFELPTSSEDLLERTLAVAAARGLRSDVLTPHHDVDTPADLELLVGEVSEELTPRTRRWLEDARVGSR
jgi:hypothetical protein